MSLQISDPFSWDKMPEKDLLFISASDIKLLFDPDKYGLHPADDLTCCYKGFVVYFALTDNHLYIEKLEVLSDGTKQPEINGVESKTYDDKLFEKYENLNLALNYSGTIIIGRDLDRRYLYCSFTGAHCYHETYELYFSNTPEVTLYLLRILPSVILTIASV